MLVIADILDNKNEVIEGLTKRGLRDPENVVEEILSLDQKRKETKTRLDSILTESNAISKEIGMLMKQGEREKAEIVKAKTTELKTIAKSLQHSLGEVEETLKEALYHVPNIPHHSVPKGNSDEDNDIITTYGELPVLSGSKKPHWELIKTLDIIDFELGNKVTGAGFPVYKNKGARLQRA